MASLGALSIKITGDITSFNKSIASVEKQLNKSTKGLSTVAKSMTTVGDSMVKGITLPILAVGAGLLKLGTDFDDAYDTIRIGTGKTGAELESLKDDFKEIAKVAPSSFQDIGTVVADLNTRLGLTGKPLQDLSVQMLNFARIAKTDINTLIPVTTRVFGDWAISTEKQSSKLVYMFKVTQNTGISIDQLSEKIVYFGAPLRQMGFDFETSAALIGKFEKEGVNTEVVLSSLRIALGRMADEGVTDTNKALNILIDRIKNAGSTGEANSIAMDTFGKKAGVDMASAIREGRFELDDLVESLNKSEDSINDAAKATDDWKEKLTLLKNNLAVAIEPLANKVFDSLGRLADEATPKIEKLTKAFGDLTPEMADNILKWGVITAAAPLLISGVGRATTGIIQFYKAVQIMNTATKGVLIPVAAFIALNGAVDIGTGKLEKMNTAWADLLSLFLKSVAPAVAIKDGVSDLAKVNKAYTDGLITFDERAKVNIFTMSETIAKIDELRAAKEEDKDATVNLADSTFNYTDALQTSTPEIDKYKVSMDEATGATEEQTQAVDELIASLYKLYNLNQSVTEANWDYEDSLKNLTEVMANANSTEREKQTAIFATQDALENLQTAMAKEYSDTQTTIERKKELAEEYITTGLKAVQSGAMSEQAFITMASTFGLTSADIIKFADLMGIKLDEETQPRLINISVNLDDREFYIRVGAVQRKINELGTGYMAALGYAKGGVVGYAKGGIIPQASAGMLTPSFDNGGILAMLHKNEVVLNAGQTQNLAKLIFGLANTKTDIGTGSGAVVNIYPQWNQQFADLNTVRLIKQELSKVL